MSSNLLKRPSAGGNDENKAKYELLNLTENPFPVTPFVNKISEDDRYNGSIYEAKIRQKEREQFVENFIKIAQSDPNHIRLGYILDNSYVGRGNGKSAFAINLVNEINKEYCLDISNEVNKCFGLHIAVEPSGRTKTFNSFSDLIFETILDKGIIQYCLAALRLESITKLHTEIVIEDEFDSDEDLIESLNNRVWFEEKGLEIGTITKEYYNESKLSQVSQGFPLNRDRNVYYNHRVSTQEDFKKYYYEGLKKGKERIHFLFNDLVLFFEAAGFNGAYLIIDDFERIPDFQSEKLKQEFALELRTLFFDGILENAKVGFYNLILVLHAGVPRLVEKAWAISGMDRRSPMLYEGEVVPKHIINFDKLTVEHAKMLLQKYLDEYRLQDGKQCGLFPFDDEAVGVISELSELNASAILEKAYLLIDEAANSKVTSIDKAFVDEKLGKQDDSSDDIQDDVSEEETEDLFKKSKKK